VLLCVYSVQLWATFFYKVLRSFSSSFTEYLFPLCYSVCTLCNSVQLFFTKFYGVFQVVSQSIYFLCVTPCVLCATLRNFFFYKVLWSFSSSFTEYLFPLCCSVCTLCNSVQHFFTKFYGVFQVVSQSIYFLCVTLCVLCATLCNFFLQSFTDFFK